MEQIFMVIFICIILLFVVQYHSHSPNKISLILRRHIYSKGSNTTMLQSSNDDKNLGCSQIPVCSWRTIKNGKDIYPRGPQRANPKFVSEVEKDFRLSCEHHGDSLVNVLRQGGALHAMVGGDFTLDNDIDTKKLPVTKTCKCKYGGNDALCMHDNDRYVCDVYGVMFWLPLPRTKQLSLKSPAKRIWVGPSNDTYIHWYGFMFDIHGVSGLKTNITYAWYHRLPKCQIKGFCKKIPTHWHSWRQQSLSDLRFYDKNDDGHISFNEIIHQSIVMGVDVNWIISTYQSDPCILYNAMVHADAYYRYLTKIMHYIDSGVDMVQYGTNTTITLPVTTNKIICHHQSMEIIHNLTKSNIGKI